MRIWLAVLVGVVALAMAVGADTRAPFRFMTLDPGHFHAGLVQKEMYPDVSPTVDVYAPEGPDLDAHLKRIAAFNGRKDSSHQLGARNPRRTRRARPHAARAPGQRRRDLREEQGQDRAHRPIRRRQPARAGRQAVDPDLRRPARPRSRAGRRRPQARRRLRHHDRAFRDHLDPAARAGQRPCRVRRRVEGHAGTRRCTWKASTT